MVFIAVALLFVLFLWGYRRVVNPRDVAWEYFKKANPKADFIAYRRYRIDKEDGLW